MTDEMRPDDPIRVPHEHEHSDQTQPADDRPGDREPAGEETPGAPGSAAPMTESTDGGLEGGDPGVEE